MNTNSNNNNSTKRRGEGGAAGASGETEAALSPALAQRAEIELSPAEQAEQRAGERNGLVERLSSDETDPTSVEAFDEYNALFDSMLDSAVAGEIVSSLQTEPLSQEQVLRQFILAFNIQRDPAAKASGVEAIPRAGGLRQQFGTLLGAMQPGTLPTEHAEMIEALVYDKLDHLHDEEPAVEKEQSTEVLATELDNELLRLSRYVDDDYAQSLQRVRPDAVRVGETLTVLRQDVQRTMPNLDPAGRRSFIEAKQNELNGLRRYLEASGGGFTEAQKNIDAATERIQNDASDAASLGGRAEAMVGDVKEALTSDDGRPLVDALNLSTHAIGETYGANNATLRRLLMRMDAITGETARTGRFNEGELVKVISLAINEVDGNSPRVVAAINGAGEAQQNISTALKKARARLEAR